MPLFSCRKLRKVLRNLQKRCKIRLRKHRSWFRLGCLQQFASGEPSHHLKTARRCWRQRDDKQCDVVRCDEGEQPHPSWKAMESFLMVKSQSVLRPSLLVHLLHSESARVGLSSRWNI